MHGLLQESNSITTNRITWFGLRLADPDRVLVVCALVAIVGAAINMARARLPIGRFAATVLEASEAIFGRHGSNGEDQQQSEFGKVGHCCDDANMEGVL